MAIVNNRDATNRLLGKRKVISPRHMTRIFASIIPLPSLPMIFSGTAPLSECEYHATNWPALKGECLGGPVGLYLPSRLNAKIK